MARSSWRVEEGAPRGRADVTARSGAATAGTRGAGRRPVTSRSEIEYIALDLFTRHGFDTTTTTTTTTVDDIAAAGIGRRTVFRYYASKNDIPWGAFDEQLDRMRATFAALPADVPVMNGVRTAVLDFNDVDLADGCG